MGLSISKTDYKQFSKINDAIMVGDYKVAQLEMYNLENEFKSNKQPLQQEKREKLRKLHNLVREGLSDQQAIELLAQGRASTEIDDFDTAEQILKEALNNKAKFTATIGQIKVAIENNNRLRDRHNAYIKEVSATKKIKRLLFEANECIQSEQLEEACKKYTDMFIAAGDNQPLRNEIHSSKEKHLELLFWKLESRSEVLIRQKNFDEAKKYLKKASDVACDPILNHEYITYFKRTNNWCSNEEAKVLQTEAHKLANEKNLEQAIIKIDVALKLANEYSTIQSLEFDKFRYSKREKDITKAKELQEKGNKCVKTNEFREAIRAFEEALDYAHEESLIQSISTDRINAINKYAKFMQEEANKLVTQNKFEDAYAKFKDAFEEARDLALVESIRKDEHETKNKQIKFLQELGSKQATENNFDQAHESFEKALKIHGDISFLKQVKAAKAKAYNLQGSRCLKQAFDLDSKEPYTEQQAKQAREKFNVAKDFFQKADETNHTKEYEQNTLTAVYKIHGDNSFNVALTLEDDAYTSYKEAKKTENEEKYIIAREKYQKMLDAFTYAKWCYDEGFIQLNRKEFKDSVKIVSEQITTISKIVKGTDMIRLWKAFQRNEHLYAEMAKKPLS